MRSIAMLGSAEQKQRWLPPMARLEKLGAFALTEPDHGSDSIALESTARRDGDSYVLNGHKKWIGNGSIADVVVVWARDTTDGQAEIELDELRIPAANQLPGAESFRNTAAVLASTRASCAWAALGHAVAGYDAALTYAQRRQQFGKRLISFQLVQNRLVKMLAKVTAMQLYCRRQGARRGP
jgi:glutaryl-CoA dehydrogenase